MTLNGTVYTLMAALIAVAYAGPAAGVTRVCTAEFCTASGCDAAIDARRVVLKMADGRSTVALDDEGPQPVEPDVQSGLGASPRTITFTAASGDRLIIDEPGDDFTFTRTRPTDPLSLSGNCEITK